MAREGEDLFDSAFLQRLEYLRVVSRRIFAGTSPGSRTGRGAGPGLEFAEHREYAPGDDFRQIDWAALARLDRLLLRLCQQEEDLAVYFLVDASASMATGDPPKFDHARRLAAALAYVAMASLERVRLVAVDGGLRGHLEAGRGTTHIVAVLEFLRNLRAGGRTDLGRAVEEFLPHARKTGLAVLISDLLDPASPRPEGATPGRSPSGYEKALLALQGRGFDLWCLHVTSAADLAPPGMGDLALADAETGDVLGVHLTEDVRQRLAAEAERFKADARAWCHERRIGYAEAPTEVPVDTLVLEVLRRGGLLR
jgi:uncharacterized protein (DUF58 family)